MEGKTTFAIESWDESTFSEVQEGGKLTRASVEKTYTGDIEGVGHLEYLMVYHLDGSADFFGLERVEGTVGGLTGTFVVEHEGRFAGGGMQQSSVIVEDSGTGELSRLRGEWFLEASHQEEYPFTFSYELG